MPRVALIGCGLVADQHVSQIRRVRGANLVAVCDLEILMARQLADRFHVPACFTDVGEMLAAARPQVVHITTPAQSHFPIARQCLEAGCHVYVEKPFTVTAPQAEELVALAQAKGLGMTVGHNLQFSPEALRMRTLVAGGFLGGPPIHMDCLQYFPHGEANYGSALLGDQSHWVRSLPGSLLQNLISHGLAKIAEFLPSDRPKVIAHVYSSPFLQRIGQGDIVDELRAVISDGPNTTAIFTFSTQLGAAANQITLYGSKASLLCDSTNRMVVPIRPTSYKSYLRYFLTPRVHARQVRSNSWQNLRLFLRKEFHMDYGMKLLTQSFYDSVQGNAPLPISYREILSVAHIMDDIFAQIPRPTT